MNKKAKKIIIGTIGAASAIVIGSVLGMGFKDAKERINEPQMLYGPEIGIDMDKEALFNAKFKKYEGTQKGSAIRTMLQEVMAYNNSAEASDETRVSVYGIVNLEAIEKAEPQYDSTFKNTKTYEVSIIYENGRVKELHVQ